MTDKVTRVSVKSVNQVEGITVKHDASMYYSKLSEKWAHGEGLIENTDYSSKYYAGVSKQHAEDAQATLNQTTQVINNATDTAIATVNNTTTIGINAIDSAVVTGRNNINALGSEYTTEMGIIYNNTENVAQEAKNTVSNKVSKSGDTMTGELFMNGANIRIYQDGISQAINTRNTGFVLADGAPSKAQPGFRMNSTDANGVITHYYQTDNPTNGDTYTAISNTVYVDGATKYYPFIIGVTSANVPYLKYNGKTMRYVTDTYMSGGSWYRIYNDGWCEQGGMNDSGNINGWQTVNFIKPYKASSIYFINVVEVNSSERKFNIDGTHNNYFRYEAIDVPAEKIRWFSCGFIE